VDLPDGYDLVRLETVDSTNAEALRRAADGAPHGTVIVAAAQSEGRGRRGRTWTSPAGNLHATIIVRPERTPMGGQLAFVAALAAGEALRPYAPVRFKWPNDLLLDGAKLGGILIEIVDGAAVVGIGVNLRSAPDDTRIPATVLPGDADADNVLGALCHGFEHWVDRWRDEGFAPLRAAWLAHADGIGGPIEARLPTRVLTGTFRGLDETGALLLEKDDGSSVTVSAGDVFFGTG